MEWQAIILLGFFVESAVQWFKENYRDKFTYLALLLGLILAGATGLNLLIMAGLIDRTPFGVVGIFMMGLVLARGANFINDLMSTLKY